ncbi:hypothetical protein D9613_000855 [Agrocybe pediades]|uniref:F-box domain-containing protein n=1 Tax=Agrocybe pediades TaxID=84607 RepID=A0A8H4R1P0_9AGAR|nr:hypothetical protein D9613_000855 [Agrocybe pediades]
MDMATLRTTVLPPEVWSQILGCLSFPQLPQMLGVCSMFHDIIIRTLFSAVKIYLIGHELGPEMLNTQHMDWVDEIARKLMCKSWEILNHICQEPRFARVVKSLTVVAYGGSQSIFERMTISRTLSFLPNLRAFQWIGLGPPMDDIIGENIPANIQKLALQSACPSESIVHLTNVTTMHFPIPFFFPDDEEAQDHLIYDYTMPKIPDPVFVDILQVMSSRLKSLRITATQVRSVPIRILSSLIDLDIHATEGSVEELVGLDLVFRHASSLESLSMVGLFVEDIFCFLSSCSKESIPNLTSFRLSLDSAMINSSVELEEIIALVNFLSNHLSLRRLFVRLDSVTWIHIYPFLCFIPKLKKLEVLGIHTGGSLLSDVAVLECIAQCLSPRLRALHIAIYWNGGSILRLVDTLAGLPDLTFLHLYGAFTRLPVLLEDLVYEAKGLQMVGLNRALWAIDRVGDEVITEKWPRWKIKFCVEEDFYCEDDAWLFKYN